ncbi:MAG TPA: phosphodiesterase [Porticoccus sp.]|nr:phosphodiesterase [Porticoccus sp.]
MPLPDEPKVLAGQLDTVFKFYPIAITSTYVLVLLNGFILWPVASSSHVVGWLLSATLLCVIRYIIYKDYLRDAKACSHRQWLIRHTVSTAVSGLIWGYAFLFLMPDGSLVHLLLLIIAVSGLCSGASSTLALSPLAFFLFLLACLVPMSLRFYLMDPNYGWLLFILCYIYMYFMWTTCQRNSESAYQNIRQSFSLAEKERELKESQQRVDLHFERSPLGIIEWDGQLKITRWNPAAEAIFGYSSKDMLGQSFQKLLNDEVYAKYFLHIAKSTQSISTVLGNITKSGATISCEWTSAGINLPAGHLLGYTSFVRDISKKLQREELMAKQAYTDPVTELPNRHYFQDRLQQEISRTSRSKKYSAVFFVDLDHFKTINDSMGHSMGDVLLQQFAQRLQTRLRQYDTVARFGGDEFVVLLQELDGDYEKSQLLAAQVAQSMQSLLQVPFKLDGADYTLTCSVGITLFNDDACSDDELLKQADLALYQSKRSGRNRYTFFEQEMSQQASRHLQLLSSLRDALPRNEMSLVYQPKVDMHTNKIMGAEALLRWNNNDFGFVSPAEFIPVLEGTSLISLVGEWVLNQAFGQLKQWCDSGVWSNDMGLAINISPKQLLDKTFVEQVEVLLAKHDIAASLIEFEITENVLVENTDKVTSVLMELSGLGISFSIDDFGTGYSSLAYLKQLPIDVLKIDKSFIDHCTVDGGNDQAIVRSVLSICNELGLTSVAEGVESEDQQKILQNMGCDLLQGYLFSRPVAPAEFVALLE